MKNMDLSYLAQRRLIGILGIALSIVLLIGAGIQKSVSQYYFTNMRDIFVAVLLITGVFLITYKGYSLIDSIVSMIAGIGMIITGLFPTSTDGVLVYSFLQLTEKTSFTIHAISSALLFISLAYMSCFVFTKGNIIRTDNKKKRNIVYIITGSIMFLFLIILGFVNGLSLGWEPFVFIGEAVMLMSFGISWLVKGETLLKDKY
jgi:hypothetical protein